MLADYEDIETQQMQSCTKGGFPHGTTSHSEASFNIMKNCMTSNVKNSPSDIRLYEPNIVWTGRRYQFRG